MWLKDPTCTFEAGSNARARLPGWAEQIVEWTKAVFVTVCGLIFEAMVIGPLCPATLTPPSLLPCHLLPARETVLVGNWDLRNQTF